MLQLLRDMLDQNRTDYETLLEQNAMTEEAAVRLKTECLSYVQARINYLQAYGTAASPRASEGCPFAKNLRNKTRFPSSKAQKRRPPSRGCTHNPV